MLDEISFQSIHWREPLWLLFALAGPFMLLLLRKAGQNKLDCFADRDLQPWARWPRETQRRNRQVPVELLYVAGWTLLSISLAGPRTVAETPSVSTSPDLNIMLVVDASRSMRAGDVQPYRLRRAGIEISELMQHAPNARLGIILYTSTAHVLVPLTRDQQMVTYYLHQLDRIPMPSYGSRPLQALRLAREEIDNGPKAADSVMLWMTDGDRSGLSDEYLGELGTFVKDSGTSVPLYVFGIGSVEGDAIPLEKGWIEVEGRPVISRMNEKWLAGLAASGNGRFSGVQSDDSDWRYLYDQGIHARVQAGKKLKPDDQVVWNEHYQWTLIPGLLLLMLSLLPFRFSSRASKLPALLVMLVLLPLATDNTAIASETGAPGKEAGKAYADGDYQLAARYYSSIPEYAGRIGAGNSYYRMDKYQSAAKYYRQAVILAGNDERRGIAIYNLANAVFMTGDYENATRLYRDALLYRPMHNKARINLALSQSLQKQVEEQMEQALARRMGSGAASRRAEAGLEINESGSLSLDSDEEPDKTINSIPKKELQHLINRGIEHAHIVSSERDSDITRSRWLQETTQARIRMRELQDLQAALWKRLFEMQDGYPAPLEEAKQLPGVAPW